MAYYLLAEFCVNHVGLYKTNTLSVSIRVIRGQTFYKPQIATNRIIGQKSHENTQFPIRGQLIREPNQSIHRPKRVALSG